MPKTLEEIFSARQPVALKGTCELTIGEEKVNLAKNIFQCGVLGDLEQIGKQFEICNLGNPTQVVRKIAIDTEVCLDVLDGNPPYCFPKETPVYYEPWMMDRGSYLIKTEEMEQFGKLATEYDPVAINCKKRNLKKVI